MEISSLLKKITKVLRISESDITEEGPISGFLSLTTADVEDSLKTERINILRELQTLNPPLSDEMKEEFLMEINLCKTNLEGRKEEISSMKNQVLDTLFHLKLNLCMELIDFIQNKLPDVIAFDANGKVQNKIPLNMSQRELAIILYGFKEAKLINMEQGQFLDLFSMYFTYFNEDQGKFCGIKPGSFKKDYSLVKKGFEATFYHHSPITKAEEKIKVVLKFVQDVHTLREKD